MYDEHIDLEDPFKPLVRKYRKEIQFHLDVETAKKAAKGECPMYDGEGDCHLYPDAEVCPIKGKLVVEVCSHRDRTLEELMGMFIKIIQGYGD